MASSTSLPKNAVWLVTGVSSGIGLSLITSVLAMPGHRVVALSRNPANVHLPANSNSSNTLLCAVDLASSESIDKAFATTIQTFGRIDVVINNAGYALQGELETIPDAKNRELFDVNYWAPVQITRHAFRVMREINPTTGPIGGVIAQISSSGGYSAVPGLSAYNASKFALEGFTEAVSKEVDAAWNIRFVIFEPGAVDTKWGTDNLVTGFPQHPAYVGKNLGSELALAGARAVGRQIATDPNDVANLMTAVVRGEKGGLDGKELLRMPVGADSWAIVRAEALDQARRFDQVKEVSESTSKANVTEILRQMGFLRD